MTPTRKKSGLLLGVRFANLNAAIRVFQAAGDINGGLRHDLSRGTGLIADGLILLVWQQINFLLPDAHLYGCFALLG